MPTTSAWPTSRLISLTSKRSACACHITQQLKRGNVDEILARAGIFQGVEPSAVSALTKQLQPVDFPRGHTVFAEGEPGDRLFIIISGKVKIGRRSPDGRENLLTIMGPSDMFGELSIFDPGPRTSSATTITEVRAVSTAYVLIDGGRESAVERVSGTTPLAMEDASGIAAHVKAGQLMGMHATYLEAGSGAVRKWVSMLWKPARNSWNASGPIDSISDSPMAESTL